MVEIVERDEGEGRWRWAYTQERGGESERGAVVTDDGERWWRHWRELYDGEGERWRREREVVAKYGGEGERRGDEREVVVVRERDGGMAVRWWW